MKEKNTNISFYHLSEELCFWSVESPMEDRVNSIIHKVVNQWLSNRPDKTLNQAYSGEGVRGGGGYKRNNTSAPPGN